MSTVATRDTSAKVCTARMARHRDRHEPADFVATMRSDGTANVLSLSRARPSRSGSATRSVAQNEARKRRASERQRVGCCEELARASSHFRFPLRDVNALHQKPGGDGDHSDEHWQK